MPEHLDNDAQRSYLEEQITLLLRREAELHLIQRKSEQLAARFLALQKINQILIATTNVEVGLQYTAKILASNMSFEKVIVFLRSEVDMQIVAYSGYSKSEVDRLMAIPHTDLAKVIEPLQNVHASTFVDTNTRGKYIDPLLQSFSLDSFLAAPITSGGMVIGAILAGYSKENAGIFAETLMLGNEDIPWFSALSYQISSMIANVRLVANLHEEHARLIASIESLPIGFAIIGRDRSLTVKNKKLSEFFNLTAAEETTASFDDIAMRLPERIGDRPFDMRTIYREVLQSKALIETKAIPLRDKFFHLFLIPIISNEDGGEEHVIGVVMLFEDITGEKNLEQSKNSFVAITSHELRTPLSIIRGNAELLLQEKNIPSEVHDMIEAIDRNVVRLLGIVNNFLDLTAIEEGRTNFYQNEFDAYALIEEVYKEFEEQAKQKNITLAIAPPESPLPLIIADRDRSKEALVNVIGNALQYTEHGSVTVRFATQPDKLKIFITDTGIGIPQDRQSALFQRFQTIEARFLKSSEYSSGMGLYSAKLLLQAMGGDIILEESELGKGSTFSIQFPIASK